MMRQVPDCEPDLQVVAYGDAKTKGSTRSFVPKRKDGSEVRRPDGRAMVITMNDAGRAAETWAGIVSTATRQAMLEQGFETVAPKVPVVIELVFFRPRPASHFGTGRNAGVLKDSAPGWPAVLPDVDKKLRLALDSLKGVAWHDDGQVVGALAWKAYGTPARMELRLWRLPVAVAGFVASDLASQNPLFAA